MNRTQEEGDVNFLDGLVMLEKSMPVVIELIVGTARWVHPDTFKALPLWYPEFARGQILHDATWSKNTLNKGNEKRETNVYAGKALVAALGTGKGKKPLNWTVCHIWGVDNPLFQKSNTVVRDSRFYSCIGNMVWLPTPLKGFTDSVPEIKKILRTCAYYLYGWACEHEEVKTEAAEIESGHIPDAYPKVWPTEKQRCLPPGTAPYNSIVDAAIQKRKAKIKKDRSHHGLPNYPRDQVEQALAFWSIEI
jgi:hypothetical protein